MASKEIKTVQLYTPEGERVMAGEIRDSKTIAGVLMAHCRKQAEKASPFEGLSPIQRAKSTFASRGT